MAPYYRLVTSSGALISDPTLFDEMEKANNEELKKLDDRLAEAEKTEGESEISDALKARANHLTRTGDKVCRSSFRRVVYLTVLPGRCHHSAEASTREDPWAWLEDRYLSRSHPNWTFLWG